jgi:pyrophosphatase PpaX
VRYASVLFDWDGCLAQTLDVWLSAFEQTFIDFDIPVSRAEIAKDFGDWDSPFRHRLPREQAAQFSKQLLQYVEVELPGVVLYPGVRDLLDALHEKSVPTAIVTSSTTANIEDSLPRYGIEHCFDAIVTVDDVTHHKPHAEPVEEALRRLGMPKETTVLIGDSDKDLGAARNAEVDSILVYPPSHEVFYELQALMAYEPTHVCRSMDDVRSVLGV